MTGQSDTLQTMCRICPYSATTDASIDPECRQFRRVVRRMKLNAIPLPESWLPESWLPELLGASSSVPSLEKLSVFSLSHFWVHSIVDRQKRQRKLRNCGYLKRLAGSAQT